MSGGPNDAVAGEGCEETVLVWNATVATIAEPPPERNEARDADPVEDGTGRKRQTRPKRSSKRPDSNQGLPSSEG
ncbi:MAG TPA: hypothetical protein VFW80_02705 [Gaiellaceae bacterium]|nr:hypothetical protein [Gaiellaceae bacterium]